MSQYPQQPGAQQPAVPPMPFQPKEVGTAYLFWFFLGLFGGHHFYLGKTGRAVGYLLTLGWLTIGLWVDLFTLPGQVRSVNQRAWNARNGVT